MRGVVFFIFLTEEFHTVTSDPVLNVLIRMAEEVTLVLKLQYRHFDFLSPPLKQID